MKTEFKKGDKVTFNAYNEPVKAVVTEVLHKSVNALDKLDERQWYLLHGRDGDSLISETTGQSIEESKLFDNTPFTWS